MRCALGYDWAGVEWVAGVWWVQLGGAGCNKGGAIRVDRLGCGWVALRKCGARCCRDGV